MNANMHCVNFANRNMIKFLLPKVTQLRAFKKLILPISIQGRNVIRTRGIFFYIARNVAFLFAEIATTTHKNHSFSDIAEVVSIERELATNTLLQLEAKIENMLGIKENVRCNHLDKLEIDSKNVVGDIESICQELTGFVQTIRNIRITETEDNAKLERQNIESFLHNIGHVHKQYSRVSAEL